MAVRGGINLCSNVDASADSAEVVWVGGRTVLVLEATAYGTDVRLQYKSLSGKWININSTTFSANQVTAYDLPPGTYKMRINGGTTTDLYAALVAVQYT